MRETPFINRIREMQWLEESYQKAEKEAQLLVLYGKRRVGKTELIRHFVADKKHIYYLATRTTTEEQLQSATSVFASGLGDTYLRAGNFANWRDFFDYLGKKIQERDERIVLIVDEFPFLAEANKGMSSYFQYLWDMWLKDSKVLLILMGSSIAMMYQHTLVYSAPLYGRRTGQWLLEPFSYKESTNFYPDSPFRNTFPLYALSGGIPAYAKVFDGNKTFEENIRKYVLPEGSFLSVEPELLLSEEFNEPRSYLTILKAIGLGRTKFSEIVTATGLSITAMPGYLQTLTNLRLIKKEVSMTEPIPEKSKKGTYSLADSFLRFYFSFIYAHYSLIKGGGIDALFQQHGEILTSLIAKTYEEASIEFIQNAISEKHLPYFYQLGRWWDKETEIDVVGINEENKSILFVETKWSDKLIGTDVLNSLKQKAKCVKWGEQDRKEHYAIVAKGGFTNQLIQKAKEEGIVLIQEDKVI
jgi:AAA+ ATPase superfamily predicted ATPase